MNKQMELPVLGDCSYPIKDLREQDIAKCSNKVQAYRMCVNNSIVARTHQTWAELLGVSRSYFTQFLNADTSDKPRYMPPDVEIKLMQLAGNRAPIQWQVMALEGRLHCQMSKEQKRAELLAELEALERTA